MLLLFGLVQANGSYRNITRSRTAEVWPSVEGVVTISRRGRQRRLRTFAYEYEVAGWGVSAFTLGELVAPLVLLVIGGYLLRLSFRE